MMAFDASEELEMQLYDCRDIWSETLADVARSNARVIAVVNDSVGSSKLNGFQQVFPTRTVNVGIAEQNMVGLAAGLAGSGLIPFVSAAGCFLTARAMEQIKADVAYSGHNVKLIGQSPGVAYGDLGATHHSIEDLTWMRALPGIAVVVPADPRETEQVVRWAAEYEGPVYVRISRMAVPQVYPQDYAFEFGRAVTLREGSDVSLMATGTVVHRALEAANLLAAQGIEARVVSIPTIKPIDRDAIVSAARETRGIVTIEEGLVTGLGGAVSEVVTNAAPCRVESIGFQDAFAQTGSAEWLLDSIGASPTGIVDRAKKLLQGT